MDLEWDPRKRVSNLRDHGIDLVDAARIFEGPVLEAADERREYGEDRIIAMGEVNNRVIVVVYTWRGTARRIISARKATSHEREAYYQSLFER